jgi:ABC-type amino acid transport substrate-binding protein
MLNKLHLMIFRGVFAWMLTTAVLASGPAQAADLDEIRARGSLRHLGINYANFVRGDGTGFDVELVQGFATAIGVRYELVYSDFYGVIRDLLGKEVRREGSKVLLEGDYPVRGDIISTGFTVLPWRAQVVLFSAPVFPSQVLLLTKHNTVFQSVSAGATLKQEIAATRDVLGKRSLLVMERTCLDPANYGLVGVGIDLRRYTASSNLDEMVPALLRGDAEFTLLDVPDVVVELQRWPGRLKIIGPISEHQDLAAAFPPNAPKLRDAFDAYLRKMRTDGSYDRLVDKHFPGIRRYFPEFFARNR